MFLGSFGKPFCSNLLAKAHKRNALCAYIRSPVNIQQVIIEGLRQQLYHHEYIVLPGFGGFVLKYRPAHFSATGLQLLPPSRTVGFNSQLRQNDGILSSWLQSTHGFTAAEANAHLDDFAAYCRSVLSHRRRLTLPGIGFFHLDLEDNLGFEPQADQNFLAESFGLAPLNMPEPFEVRETKRKVVFEDRRPAPAQKPAAGTRKILAVASASMLILITLVILLPQGAFKGEFQSAVFGSNVQKTYQPVAYQPLDLVEPDTVTMIKTQQGEAVKLGELLFPVGNEEAAKAVSNARYEIVLGCFSIEGNAEKLVRRLKRQGISSEISIHLHRGMHVVIMKQLGTRSEALQLLPQAQSVVKGAWIRNL